MDTRISIDLPDSVVKRIDLIAKETGRTRKAMCQVLLLQKLKELNYKPQLDLTNELK